MICPRCGTPNTNHAGECVNCHHKFRLGHAFNDPAHATYPVLDDRSDGTRPHSGTRSAIRYAVWGALMFAFALIVYSFFVESC